MPKKETVENLASDKNINRVTGLNEPQAGVDAPLREVAEPLREETRGNEETGEPKYVSAESLFTSDTGNSLIYCGPSIPKKGIKQFTVFIDSFPKALNDALSLYPPLRRLIVPIDELPRLKERLNNEWEAEYQIFKTFAGKINEL